MKQVINSPSTRVELSANADGSFVADSVLLALFDHIAFGVW
jgi:hypothetical protein